MEVFMDTLKSMCKGTIIAIAISIVSILIFSWLLVKTNIKEAIPTLSNKELHNTLSKVMSLQSENSSDIDNVKRLSEYEDGER